MGVRKNRQSPEETNLYGYSVTRNLQDAGCTDELIREFMALESEQEKERQLRLLTLHRKTLLEKVHQEEKKIDCLDYLIYQMQKKP